MSESSVHGPAFAAAVGLALISGVFLLAAHAMVATRHRRIERRLAQGLSPAGAALKVRGELNAALAAAEVGAILCAVSAGWIGAPALTRWIGDRMPSFPGGGTVAGAAALLLLAALFVLLGHALPRRLAELHPERAAGIAVPVLLALSRILFPLTYALHALALALFRLTGLKPALKERPGEDEAALKLLSLASRRLGLLGEVQRDLLAQVFEYDEAPIGKVMTPRSEMACIPSTMRAKEALEAVRHLGFTRFPVCDREKDRVIGLIHIRELVDAVDVNPRRPVTDVMTATISLPVETPVGAALKEMQAHRVHLAVVVGAHGSTAGLVTTEDLLGELLGERSVSDGTRERWKAVSADTFELDGSLLVGELEEALDVDLHHVGIETIGDFISGKLGRKPHAGDSVKVDGLRFDILDARGTRILRLRVQKERGARSRVRRA